MHRPRPQRTHSPRQLAALAITSLALTFSTGTASAASQPGEPSNTLSWHSCGSKGAQCSSLQVPRDAGTRSILRDIPAAYFPKALLRRFEIVGVDPRGVRPGRPAVECGLPTRNAKITLTPSTRAGYRRLLAYNRHVGQSCLAHTGPLLSNVDTVSTARDLDAARAALGVEQVSWLGVSYGSLLGQTYAHLFPSRVRAAVLDGALDHTVGSTRLALDEAHSAEGEFAQFAQWCDADASCALHGRDVKATYRSLLARARRHPVPARGTAAGATADEIGYGTYALMEVSRHWPLLATYIKDAVALHPNAAPLARIGEPAKAAYRATTCDDFPTDINNYPEFQALLGKLRKAAPVFGPYVEGWDVDTACMGWPVRSRNPWGPVPVSGTPPLLVVSGAHDPSTPNSWGRGLARQIRGSRLLLWKGSGHTGYFNDASVTTCPVWTEQSWTLTASGWRACRLTPRAGFRSAESGNTWRRWPSSCPLSASRRDPARRPQAGRHSIGNPAWSPASTCHRQLVRQRCRSHRLSGRGRGRFAGSHGGRAAARSPWCDRGRGGGDCVRIGA